MFYLSCMVASTISPNILWPKDFTEIVMLLLAAVRIKVEPYPIHGSFSKFEYLRTEFN